MTKIPSLILMILMFLNPTYGQDVMITSQAEMDAFDINTTEINGSLSIGDFNNPDPVTDLTNLSNLTRIEGSLVFLGNSTLSSLNGLSSLEKIGVALEFSNNSSLVNLDGLDHLDSIGWGLIIKDNDNLVNIDALSSVSWIDGHLWVMQNNSLINMDGLSNVEGMDGDILIRLNPSLTSISGLLGISSVEELWIAGNDSLVTLEGLDHLEYIGERLLLNNNGQLSNLDALYNLSHVAESFGIIDNHLLYDCCAIQDLLGTEGAIGGSITISGNPSLCSSAFEITELGCFSVNVNNPNNEAQELSSISPNPVRENVRINLHESISSVSVIFYSGVGEMMHETEISANEYLDVSSFENGLYFIVLKEKSGGILGVHKMMKMD